MQITKETPIAMLTVGQLQEVLGLNHVVDPEPEKRKNLTISEAVEYLNEIGIPITKSTLYRHTMNATIPFKRFGERKLIFSTAELDSWAKNKLK